MPLPVLRYIDATPVVHEGDTLICLHDPEGYSEQQLLLSAPAFFVASLLDGINDVTDIQYAFVNQYGEIIPAEDIGRVIEALDEAGFLLNKRFAALRDRLNREYRSRSTRPAFFAGRSYPKDPSDLREFLDSFFVGEGGPGETPPASTQTGAPLPGLIVPHIDFHRGGLSYAHGYLQLAKGARPDVVFVFGVAHSTPPVPLVLTRKSYETPLGTLQTDGETVDAISEGCPWDPFAYESLHRTEHSIEFQAVMLAHIYGPSVQIVPILCGSFARDEDDDLSVLPEVDAFLERCREVARTSSRGYSVIAGADLAHVGQRFGDDFDIDDRIVKAVEARDREDLSHARDMRATEFYRSVMKDGNERRVCGINCIYSALRTLEGRTTKGELLKYGYAPDPAGGIVSFANVVFR